jgi:hypothetical protein
MIVIHSGQDVNRKDPRRRFWPRYPRRPAFPPSVAARLSPLADLSTLTRDADITAS